MSVLGIIIFVSIVLAVGVFLYVLRNGKPVRLSYEIIGFADSIETVNPESGERKRFDYQVWGQDAKAVELLVRGKLLFNSDTLKWNKTGSTSVFFKIFNDRENPSGFEGEIIESGNSSRIFGEGYKLDAALDDKDEFTFKIRFSKTDINAVIRDKTLLKFTIEGTYSARALIFNTGGSRTKTYEFYLGPDLGDTWVSFDPGTTGSCLAAGSPVSDGIVMEQKRGEDRVIPSVITFNTKQTPSAIEKMSDLYPLYNYGANAAAQMNLGQNRTFQSIKKLLGYTDEKVVTFANSKTIALSGKKLSTLLVHGIMQDFKSYLEDTPGNRFLLAPSGEFNPLRAVVAVPNNYTPSKIDDMLGCIRNLNQFEEIRYVTEAEAVLCYYLSEHNRLHPKGGALSDETILIFDMGGSTINTTVADVYREKHSDRYKIEIDSKIGYSIGGDTIDYCLAKTIFSFENIFPQLKGFNPFNDDLTDSKAKRELLKQVHSVVFDMKKDIVRRYYDEPLIIKNPKAAKVPSLSISEAFFDNSKVERDWTVLLTKSDLERVIYRLCGQETAVLDDSPLYELFKSDHSGKYPLFRNEYFQKYVYGPINDAVNDVIGLSEGRGSYIDTLIFSGRSCLFPLIKESVRNVTDQIQHTKDRAKDTIVLKGNELKTAVARGSCWYGVHKEAVEFSSPRLNSNYGVKRTTSPDKSSFDFVELLRYGKPFDLAEGADNKLRAEKTVTQNFTYDGNRVNFFQIMGEDAKGILEQDQKHKYSLIASIRVQQQIAKVGIAVSPGAQVECGITTVTDKEVKVQADKLMEEVVNDNEEHYTWIIS